MKQKYFKKTIKKQNPNKVSKKFIALVDKVMREHEDVLRELSNR